MRVVILTVLLLGLSTGLANAADWWNSISVFGDLRYRHEMIDEEGKDTRNRHRIRARLGVDGDVNERIKVRVQLATGSDDPVSTNQTLDNGFSTKDLRLDLAYFQMTHERLTGWKLTAGKFKNPFYKPGSSELLWDSDFNPEGGAIHFSQDIDDFSVSLIGSGLYIEERSSDEDSYLAAAEGVLGYDFNDGLSSVSVGGGYFEYVNTSGFGPFYDADEPMGNSVDANGMYLNDYQLVELFAEFTHKFETVPVVVMGDFVTNTGADSLDTGWLVGLRVGKKDSPGSWDFRYIYREVEKDAVLGTFTDSDFRGGGTDAKGHEIGGGVKVMKNADFNVSYFVNTIGIDAEELDFNRLQVDLQLKFK